MTRFATMPASRIGGAFKLFVLFAVQIGFVVVFHALGSIDSLAVNFSDLSTWLEETSPEIALVASVRLLALVFSYWMLATSVIYMLARSFHLTGLIRAMEFTTIPGVRKIIDAGLAAAIVGGTVFGGAAAVFAKQADAGKIATPAAATRVLYNPGVQAVGTTTGSPLVNPNATASDTLIPIVNSETNVSAPNKKVVQPSQSTDQAQTTDNTGPTKNDDGNYIPTPAERYVAPSVDEGDIPQPAQTNTSPKVVLPTDDEAPTTTSPKITVPPTTAPITSDPNVEVGGKQVIRDDAPDTQQEQQEGSYTVVSGDNFWKIARQQVRDAKGEEPSNAEIANYWVRLIDANRDNIRSGDPDLIFPGEVFVLPPV